MNPNPRIVLADDHPIVLAGLRNLLQSAGDLELVGEATDGLAALRVICERQPDVAVVDISMPELNGIALTRRLAQECPSVRVLVLTLHEDRAYLKQALEAGASGYVLKRSAAESLLHAIRAIANGERYVDPALGEGAIDPHPVADRQKPAAAGAPALTPREGEVLRLAAQGFSNKEIARQLEIGVKSVETYKARGTEKLALKSRAELVRYASTQGWLAGI